MKNDKTSDTTAAAEQAGVAVPKSASRRRLLQAGIGASPVLLSVMSRPVLANNVSTTCRSPSALASIAANPATSRAAATDCGSGQGPVGWKGDLGACAGGGNLVQRSADDPTTSIGVYPMTFANFGVVNNACVSLGTNTTTNNPTLRQILVQSTGTSEKDVLARNIAATMMNVLTNNATIPGVTVATLQAMWQTVGERGSRYAVTGAPNGWGATELNQFLAQTWVVSRP